MDATHIKKTVSDLLESMGLSIQDIEISAGSRTIVAVSSSDSALLIGQNGEHLQALNTVVRRLVESNGENKEVNFLIDINGYHEKKLQQLRENVLLLAQRARLFKHEVELSPMNSYERLVVHELFAEDPEIQTESQGEGKTRHIVLKYKTNGASYESEHMSLKTPLI